MNLHRCCLVTLLLCIFSLPWRSTYAQISAPAHKHLAAKQTFLPKKLHGFSWFGFNNGGTMVNGLWSNPALALDFATIVYRQQLLGFNAVRLPVSFQNLFTTAAPESFVQSCVLPTNTNVALSTLLPGETLPAKIPVQAYQPTRSSNTLCNEYLPNKSVLERFVWVVDFYTRNGFYVLIDNHTEDPTVNQNPNLWVQQWAQLANALVDLPYYDQVIFDLLNEPDARNINWDATGSGRSNVSLTNLYLNSMDAIEAVAPNSRFFIEGAGQLSLQVNYGDGFCTNANLIQSLGLSDPRAFFTKLQSKSYRHRVSLAPHVYGPAVTGATSSYEGPSLWNRLTESFGTLSTSGFLGQVFNIVIGEFGSQFTQTNDIQTMLDLATYMNDQNAAAAAYAHAPITRWFYWAWNNNSGDTGGLVASDWFTLETKKIAYLRTLGLTPWRK